MLSRVADSLYWMSRYLERTEHSGRMMAVKLESMIEQTPEDVAASWMRVSEALTGEIIPEAAPDAFAATSRLAFDRENAASLIASLSLARDNARQVREALSIEVWDKLNRLYLRLAPVTMNSIWVHSPARLFREVLEDLHALEGVTNSTLSHGEGWYFLELGKHIERAQLLGRLLDVHFRGPRDGNQNTPKYFDWLVLLKFCTAFEPYTKLYTASIRPQKIAEFLLFDPEFPHSIRFSVAALENAIKEIGGEVIGLRSSRIERIAGRLSATLGFGQIDEIMSGGIQPYLDGVLRQCGQMHSALFQTFISYPIEAALQF